MAFTVSEYITREVEWIGTPILRYSELYASSRVDWELHQGFKDCSLHAIMTEHEAIEPLFCTQSIGGCLSRGDAPDSTGLGFADRMYCTLLPDIICL
jgi:hypothetical protein